METAIRDLLYAADDPVHAEGDPALDWPAIHTCVTALKSELERIAGRAFVQDNNVQDASFFTELAIQRPGTQPNFLDTVFAVRFSGFGMLFTTWSQCEAERLSDALAAELMAAVSRAGFQYVSAAALDAPYTGKHEGFVGSSWWNRFFDYV